MTDVLLVVALRTDQPEIKRRIDVILAAAQPVEVRTEPCAWAKPVDELTAADHDALTRLYGPGGVARLNIGEVSQ